MPADRPDPPLRLPKSWPDHLCSAMVHVLSLARLACGAARGWAAEQINTRVRLKAELGRCHEEIAHLREEMRIKDARMARAPARRLPYYSATERMSILELRAARGWSLEQTARAFLLAAATVVAWVKRMDEGGPNVLVRLNEPVNKFPDFVRYIVQRLKALCPMLGKVKIAEILARAGLHLGATTVGRILKEPAAPEPTDAEPVRKKGAVTSKYPNHVWLVDLTTVSIGSGFWTAWSPFSLLQCWPFCWWVGVVLDHYSRRVMGVTLFRKEPTSVATRAFLGRVIHAAGATPRHLVSDKGPQFWCDEYPEWCDRRDIKPRFGAVGQHGSIAIIERLIRTLKQSLRWLPLVPLQRGAFLRELQLVAAWYNTHRPHVSLDDRTPDEVYHNLRPANRQPRFEPRAGWPRSSPCATPVTLVKGQQGVRLRMEVECLSGRKLLPVVRLQRAA